MRMASTRAAVITVIITQPGTSPRSGSSPRTRAAKAASAACSIMNPRVMASSSPVASAGSLRQRDDADQPREQGEENGHRKHQEDDRDQHRDLLPPTGFEQPPLAGLADVGGLRAQHLRQGRTALEGDEQTVDEAGQRV